ncbi:MAG: tetraacyldisaccharide 4'-kinase [Pseudomonadota bacterium]
MTGAQRWLYSVWYEGGTGGWALRPLEWLFRCIVAVRRFLYRNGVFKSLSIDAPVVVVGNIAVGGGGKTPLVGWLARQLSERNLRIAIISRGYGGDEPTMPLRVDETTPAAVAGDEAKMLAALTGVPVYVCRDRVSAANVAHKDGANLILADDGLQHYRLGRAMEIAVVDAVRQHGNRRCLPAGPLREPVSRLSSVDVIVASGGKIEGVSDMFYTLDIQTAINGASGVERPLAAFYGQSVYALAGIAHPQRFVDMLSSFGLRVLQIPAADHQTLDAASIDPDDALAVLMTEKDAVKYDSLSERHWIVPAQVEMEPADAQRLLDQIQSLRSGP